MTSPTPNPLLSEDEKIDEVLELFRLGFDTLSDEFLTKVQARQAIKNLLVEAEEKGRNEVYEAIEDGRLVTRRFVTKEQLSKEYKSQLSEEKNNG